MGKAIRVLRRSLHAFFQSYHSFTSVSALLVFPVSVSVLLSQSLPPSSPILRSLSSRLRLLFLAAGFPASSEFFYLLNIKLSQTILTSIVTLPLSLTFLLLAKAIVIRIILEHRHHRLPFSRLPSVLCLCKSLFVTHLFNSFVMLSANAAVFSILFISFNMLEFMGMTSTTSILTLSAAGAVLYSLILANTMVICNMATIASVLEDCRGYQAVLRACMIIRGQETTAMTLALPANLGMAAAEALFQYKVMKPYHLSHHFSLAVLWETFSLTYIHALLMVLDIVISYVFYKSCEPTKYQKEMEPEDKAALQA